MAFKKRNKDKQERLGAPHETYSMKCRAHAGGESHWQDCEECGEPFYKDGKRTKCTACEKPIGYWIRQ